MNGKSPVSSADSGIYVHYPYCEKKCPYCDFNVHAIAHDDRLYADAVLAELTARMRSFPSNFRSLYFGGGTPSEWAPDQLSRVIDFVRPSLVAGAEITVEANPGTVAEERIVDFARAGANRFSIGAQSFLDRELDALGRSHRGEDIARAISAAKATGARVSLDLIYAIPGQTEDDVARSIDRALALEVDHLSAYTLTIEPDTPLGRKTKLGLFEPMDDDLQASMIELVTGTLARAGFERYEISSYAAPGREAVHNSIYWAGGAYLGAGAGAHSYLPAPQLAGAVRRENVRSPDRYIESALAGATAATFEEALDRRQAIGDRLLTGMRTKWGIDLAALAREAGLDPAVLETSSGPVLARLAEDGLVERIGTAARPTARGFLFSDLIARRLLAALP